MDENHTRTDAIVDAAGQRIDYLRISLTDRCNFRCIYCMPPEGVTKLRHEDMLTLEELAEITRLLVDELGFRKVRVTGGEPLLRRGALEFLAVLGRMPGICDLSLTTNGFYLAEMAEGIWAAGVRRLNISLDTLQRERFAEITGVDGLPQVLAGIEAAKRRGFSPIKINVVCMRETLAEATRLVHFGIDNGLQVRFIELMPSLGVEGAVFVPSGEIHSAIESEFELIPIADPPADAPLCPSPPGAARLYRVAGTEAVCGFISPITQPFCESCNRIRLRGDGKLLPCLSSAQYFDLMPYVRPELRAGELLDYLRGVLPGCKLRNPGAHVIRSMFKIGG